MTNFLLLISAIGALILLAFMLKRSSARAQRDTQPIAPKRARVIDSGLEQRIEEVRAAQQPTLPERILNFRLLTEEEVTPSAHNTLMKEIRNFKKPPDSLHSLLSPASLTRASTQELADIIKQEPVLVAKIMSAVNSPLYGLQQQITSVQHGIAFMGVNAIRDLAIRYMLEDAAQSVAPEFRKLYQRIWNTSILASQLCQLLLRQLQQQNIAEASTRTILSFLGDLPLINIMGAADAERIWSLPLLERISEQQQTCGVNSDIAGRITLQQWNIPQGIILGIDRVHRVPFMTTQAEDDSAVQAILIYLSARLCDDLMSARTEVFDDDLLARDEYVGAMGALPESVRSGMLNALNSVDIRALSDRIRDQRA